MKYSKQILGKEIDDLTKEDLEEFFSIDKIETSTLEFKSGETEPHKLFKEIAGMLNCEGGLIILGAPIEKDLDAITKFGVCQGDLTTVTKFKSPDSIAHKINSNINEIPIGIKVHPIPIAAGEFAYVIEVPKSTNPPHQVSRTGVYYIRINGDSIPSPHGIVQSLFNRRSKPDLRIYLSAKSPQFPEGMRKAIELKPTLRNKSEITADDPHILLKFYDIESYKKAGTVMAINYKGDEPKFLVKHNWDTPLVDGLSIGLTLNVDSTFDYLVIEACYWCRNTRLKKKYFLIGKQGDNIITHQEVDGTGDNTKDGKILTTLIETGIEIYETE